MYSDWQRDFANVIDLYVYLLKIKELCYKTNRVTSECIKLPRKPLVYELPFWSYVNDWLYRAVVISGEYSTTFRRVIIPASSRSVDPRHARKFKFSVFWSRKWSRCTMIGRASSSRSGRSGVWIPARKRSFSLLQVAHTGSRDQTVFLFCVYRD